MKEIVRAIYHRSSGVYITLLIMTIAICTLSFLLICHALSLWLSMSPLVTHATLGVGWLFWLRYVFDWSRRHYLQSDAEHAYARAYYTNILPGVSCNFGQMLRPVFYGGMAALSHQPYTCYAFLGVTLSVAGFALIYAGCKAIGVAQAFFLYEYKPSETKMSSRGIYGCLRHPMFLGGVLLSVGLSLLFCNGLVLCLTVINIFEMFLYARCEDARCSSVYGGSFTKYRHNVPGFIPKL